MSKLIFTKLTEAQQLLTEARQEETEGAVLAAKIAELQRESERLLKSAREKHVIGTSQFEASKALAKEQAIAIGELVDEPAAAAPAKKVGKGAKGKAAAVAAATPPALPATKKGGKGAKKAAAAPAETPVAPAAVKPAKTKAASAAVSAPKAARAATGEKGPPLHEKIKIVMGAKEMTIPEVIDALKAHDKSWVPKSQDLGAYISLVLSTHLNDHFDRVKRGVYKVKKGAPPTPPTGGPGGGPGLVKTNGKKGPNGSNGSHAGSIDELGTNVLESPFAGADAAA